MAGVKLAEHLRHQLGKVAVVGYRRHLGRIGGAHGRPIDAVKVRVVKLVVHLAPDVLKQVIALRVGAQRQFAAQRHGLKFNGVLAQLAAQQGAVGEHDQRIAGKLQRRRVGAQRGHLGGLVIVQVMPPEVVTALGARQVIERREIVSERGVAKIRGVLGQAHGAPLDGVKIDGDGGALLARSGQIEQRGHVVAGALIVALVVALAVIGSGAGLLVILAAVLFQQRTLLLGQAVAPPTRFGKKRRHHVALRTPGTVGAQAVAIAVPEDHIAADVPQRRAVVVAV